jgi:AcrR family transcriptional regulator
LTDDGATSATNVRLAFGTGGAALRPKGARTRRRIMEATAQLLHERTFADIRITDIARAADIAQPNFYTYFSSLEAVVQALGEELSVEPLLGFLEPPWTPDNSLDLARGLAEAAVTFFREYGPIFAIVTLLADKQFGDFPNVRLRLMRPLFSACEVKVRAAQAEGRLSTAMHPRLAAYECVSILASPGSRYALFRDAGFTHRQLVESTAQMVCRLLGAG